MYIKPNQLIKNPEPERNAKCPCQSGKKYKRCCLVKINQTEKLEIMSNRKSRK